MSFCYTPITRAPTAAELDASAAAMPRTISATTTASKSSSNVSINSYQSLMSTGSLPVDGGGASGAPISAGASASTSAPPPSAALHNLLSISQQLRLQQSAVMIEPALAPIGQVAPALAWADQPAIQARSTLQQPPATGHPAPLYQSQYPLPFHKPSQYRYNETAASISHPMDEDAECDKWLQLASELAPESPDPTPPPTGHRSSFPTFGSLRRKTSTDPPRPEAKSSKSKRKKSVTKQSKCAKLKSGEAASDRDGDDPTPKTSATKPKKTATSEVGGDEPSLKKSQSNSDSSARGDSEGSGAGGGVDPLMKTSSASSKPKRMWQQTLAQTLADAPSSHEPKFESTDRVPITVPSSPRRSGKPVPIVASGFRAVSDFQRHVLRGFARRFTYLHTTTGVDQLKRRIERMHSAHSIVVPQSAVDGVSPFSELPAVRFAVLYCDGSSSFRETTIEQRKFVRDIEKGQVRGEDAGDDAAEKKKKKPKAKEPKPTKESDFEENLQRRPLVLLISFHPFPTVRSSSTDAAPQVAGSSKPAARALDEYLAVEDIAFTQSRSDAEWHLHTFAVPLMHGQLSGEQQAEIGRIITALLRSARCVKYLFGATRILTIVLRELLRRTTWPTAIDDAASVLAALPASTSSTASQPAEWTLFHHIVDPQLAAWMLDSDGKKSESYNLPDLLQLWCRPSPGAAVALSSTWSGPNVLHPPSTDCWDVAGCEAFETDLIACDVLWCMLHHHLLRQSMLVPFAIQEMPIAPILSLMEVYGIAFNGDTFEEAQEAINRRRTYLEGEAWRLAGEEFSLLSPKQVSYILFEKLGLKKVEDPSAGQGTRKNIKVVKKQGFHTTSERVLQELSHSHPLPGIVVNYRHLTRLSNTPVPVAAGAATSSPIATKRIYTSWIQTGTATGRISSRHPNLQALPKRGTKPRTEEPPSSRDVKSSDADGDDGDDEEDPEGTEHSDERLSHRKLKQLGVPEINIRDAFLASNSRKVLLSADYSQMEMRILADTCKDDNLIQVLAHGSTRSSQLLDKNQTKVFQFTAPTPITAPASSSSAAASTLDGTVSAVVRSSEPHVLPSPVSGGDVYELMAQRAFNIIGPVSKEDRDKAKTLSLGVLYGMGPQNLASQLSLQLGHTVSTDSARKLMEKWHKLFNGVNPFITRTKFLALKDGFVRTVSQRRRHFSDLNSENSSYRSYAERQAVNAVIQGSASDILKRALIRIHAASQAFKHEIRNEMRSKLSVPTVPAPQVASTGEGDPKPDQKSIPSVLGTDATVRKVDTDRESDDDDPCHIVLQLHDEIVLEVEEKYFDRIAAFVAKCMESAVQASASVPYLVNIKRGTRLGSLSLVARTTSAAAPRIQPTSVVAPTSERPTLALGTFVPSSAPPARPAPKPALMPEHKPSPLRPLVTAQQPLIPVPAMIRNAPPPRLPSLLTARSVPAAVAPLSTRVVPSAPVAATPPATSVTAPPWMTHRSHVPFPLDSQAALQHVVPAIPRQVVPPAFNLHSSACLPVGPTVVSQPLLSVSAILADRKQSIEREQLKRAQPPRLLQQQPQQSKQQSMPAAAASAPMLIPKPKPPLLKPIPKSIEKRVPPQAALTSDAALDEALAAMPIPSAAISTSGTSALAQYRPPATAPRRRAFVPPTSTPAPAISTPKAASSSSSSTVVGDSWPPSPPVPRQPSPRATTSSSPSTVASGIGTNAGAATADGAAVDDSPAPLNQRTTSIPSVRNTPPLTQLPRNLSPDRRAAFPNPPTLLSSRPAAAVNNVAAPATAASPRFSQCYDDLRVKPAASTASSTQPPAHFDGLQSPASKLLAELPNARAADQNSNPNANASIVESSPVVPPLPAAAATFVAAYDHAAV